MEFIFLWWEITRVAKTKQMYINKYLQYIRQIIIYYQAEKWNTNSEVKFKERYKGRVGGSSRYLPCRKEGKGVLEDHI